MTQLQWITPQGNLANLVSGLPATIKLLATNTAHNGSTLTYTKISGELPIGMALGSNGELSGTPIYSAPSNNYYNTVTYNFIVRVTSSDGTKPIDGTFKIILNNTTNSGFSWATPAGTLGTLPAGEYFQVQLLAETNLIGETITYALLSGEVPPGIGITKTGLLEGVPTVLNVLSIDKAQTYDFTIRATNSRGMIQDRAFSLTVTDVYGPVITPSTTVLGDVMDGTWYEQQLYVIELNPNVAISWSNIGSLPPGVTLSSTGLLSGYVLPAQVVGEFGPAGYDGNVPAAGESGAILQTAEYDYAPYDFNQLNQTVSYSFTIQAFDGANYDLQYYILNVLSRSGFTSDNNLVTADNNLISIDTLNAYIPVILNADVRTLPVARSSSNYAYKFEGFDFQGDVISYFLSSIVGTFDAQVAGIDDGFDYGGDIITHLGGVGFDSYGSSSLSSNNLPGLILDGQTGWLYGTLDPQGSPYQEYVFGVQVSKTRDGITYTSIPTYFVLPVINDVNNTLEWVTDTNLGQIYNGSVCELFVEAKSFVGKELVYSLPNQADVPVRLPQGLKLLPSGELSGRVSFESFSLDDYATTFDGDTLTIDKTFTFTVQVDTIDGTATATKEFTLEVIIADQKPYDNLYLRAMPSLEQRQLFNSIVNNKDIFVPELIYRSDDPWYGVNKQLEMLFLPGLTPETLTAYATAMINNHYTKTYTFGDIKTAVVLDDNYKVKYEVVYIKVNDPEENSLEDGPPLEINLTNVIANPYIDEHGNEFKIVYPNSSENMTDRIVAGIEYYDQSSLPPWMTSNQPDPTNPNKFSTPIGFTKAVVLAYTKPVTGQPIGYSSNLIAYRLKNSGINFNSIDFTVDRYLLDNYYSNNFNVNSKTYVTGRETTFDLLPNQNIGTIVASVTYAVTKPFSQINGRPVVYINNNGGIDGITNFQDGDTLIFVQQENFLNPGPYDGWVDYTDAFIGDDIETSIIEGYDGESYDTYTLIPGYLEKIHGTSTVNKRGGIWKINIVNDIVNLTFVQEIEVNQRVQILGGLNFKSAVLFYNSTIAVGASVPAYTVYNVQLKSIRARTTFNKDTTKFFSYRDQYYDPGTQDKYVKFTQSGVFN